MAEGNQRESGVWLVPVLFMLVLGSVLCWLFIPRGLPDGPVVDVTFAAGHGLRVGDSVKSRGIDVGVVVGIELAEEGVAVLLQLESAPARRLAREGTRWWIARPSVEISRVQGLESLLAPRWVQVDPAPGESPPCTTFVGLDSPPIVESIGPGDLQLSLLSTERGTMHRGASVFYRGVPIGIIRNTTLAGNARSVIAEVLIYRRFTPLVRNNSRFYETGSFDLDIGLDGINARLDSLETLIVGGVSLVTPDDPGDPARTGDVFEVDREPESAWLRWSPRIPLSDGTSPAGD